MKIRCVSVIIMVPLTSGDYFHLRVEFDWILQQRRSVFTVRCDPNIWTWFRLTVVFKVLIVCSIFLGVTASSGDCNTPQFQRSTLSLSVPVPLSPCPSQSLSFSVPVSQDGISFHPDSAWKRSSKICMKITSAECTIENSWWWAQKMPETCRVL
jgi:hypothetical protein